MKSRIKYDALENLHQDLLNLFHQKKLHLKSAICLSELDILAEQLWILRLYQTENIIPNIKQSQLIVESYRTKKLTLKKLNQIMDSKRKPQKLVFNYSDFASFFEMSASPEEIKKEVLKVLSNWKNNRK